MVPPPPTTSNRDPYGLFIYSINSPVTRQKYTLSMGRFFRFVGLPGSIEEQSTTFVQKSHEEDNWAFYNILRFLQMQRERIESKVITASAIWNYVRPIKLFTETNEIDIVWKRLTRGLQALG
jgi:hypothetical protein